MTTAEELGRRAAPWPCELRRGVAHRLAEADPAAARVAARIGRVLLPAAEAAGAWVSTEALVRVERNPDTALHPAVAVAAGPLPYGGVIDAGLVVVVELDVRRVQTWLRWGAGPVWVPQARGVLVAEGTSTQIAPAGAQLALPGHAGAILAAAELCRVIAVSG